MNVRTRRLMSESEWQWDVQGVKCAPMIGTLSATIRLPMFGLTDAGGTVIADVKLIVTLAVLGCELYPLELLCGTGPVFMLAASGWGGVDMAPDAWLCTPAPYFSSSTWFVNAALAVTLAAVVEPFRINRTFGLCGAPISRQERVQSTTRVPST